jgi:predicted DNA-binding transcriptional regulator AlpA
MNTAYIRMGGLATTKGKSGLMPFSPATIWRKVKDGSFPKPVKLGERITAWHLDDIEAWLTARHEEAVK